MYWNNVDGELLLYNGNKYVHGEYTGFKIKLTKNIKLSTYHMTDPDGRIYAGESLENLKTKAETKYKERIQFNNNIS